MRNHTVCRWIFTAAALILGTAATAQNAIRISEIHYDNVSTDVGEAIEVSAPAGTDLTGWQIVLYNGSGGASYDTDTFTGVVPASCGARGVLVIDYPSNGIQNGAPDGVALVDSTGTLVEFLSYEGTFAATNGPANGVTSTDIGALQNGAGSIGESLARNADGTWALGASTFGACNDDGEEPPVGEVDSIAVDPSGAEVAVGGSVAFVAAAFDIIGQEIPGVAFSWTSSNPDVATVNAAGVATGIAEGDTIIFAIAENGVSGSANLHINAAPPPTNSDFHINEIHYDNLGVDAGEAIEIEGPAGANLSDFTVVLYNGNGGVPYNTQTLGSVLPASCGTRGVVVINYPQDGIQNGSPDAIALVSPTGVVLEFLSYEGVVTAITGPAGGLVSTDILASQTNAPVGSSLQRSSTGVWASGTSSFGACNSDAPTPVGNSLSFSGRVPTDPALPVGYEDQVFATLRSPGNVTIPTTITWTSETPAIASIDENGVMRALAEGLATVRATATDGTTATYSLPTRVAVASGVAYPGNTEFGEPADADASDDIILRYDQFTTSYNPARGTPNWVSYDLDAVHFGAEDRCDCFTLDADLPASVPRITTNDYTGAGAFHGFGIDRGHMVRSFDRTTGSLDNARTYLFSNIVPQAADMNQGPWANLESDLGDIARVQGREVYIITGPAGNSGTLKNEGKIVIPTSTWKVAVILPHDQGLANIDDYRDLEVIAVNMPNQAGVRNVDWNTYRTTVDEIETLTGYDLLALLPDEIEAAVESNTQPPFAAVTGPAGAIAEGDSATFDASASEDPNGTIASYAWDFGDGTTGTGVSVSHTFVQDGVFTVRVTVTDNDGLSDSATFTVNVTNVAPVVGAVPNATLDVGATYTATGSFSDPGADAWTATVTWGDGSAPEVVPLSGRNFSLTHIYTAGGTYTVTISIADDDTSASATHTVTVQDPAPDTGLAAALPLIDQLVASGKLPRAVGTLFKAEVIAAQVLIGRGNVPAARRLLQAEVAQIDLLVRLRVVKAADIAPLRNVLVQAIAAL
ncbi:MAG TPA: DNA/RNA non-specific endonuclease [Steroidobacteraceae bacterium]|nr:DNA/RNA non-specific endonuclease [Steroidobacteraceae bacterium]